MSSTSTGLPPAPTDGLLPGNGTFGNETAPPLPPMPVDIEITPRAAYLAQIFFGLSGTLLFLCVITYSMRMYQRVRPVWKIGADDWFITLGFLLAIVDFGLMGPQQIPVATRISFDTSIHATKHSWIGIGIWGLSMACIKVSIALTLLRIQGKSLAWRIFLYTIMFVCTAYGILNLFFNLVIACRPLAAAWDFRIPPDQKVCVSIEVQRLASNIGSGINISTDVLLSLAPGIFLRKLNRPLRERLFICFLMSLGLLATVSSILKTVIIQQWGDPTVVIDFWAQGVAISTYTILEQFCGVLAACVPALKGLLQSGLKRMGVSLTESRSRPGRSGYYLNDRSANGTGGFGASRTAASQFGSRYARSGKDDPAEDDEEKCLEMPEIRRGAATPTKSTRTNSGSFRESDFKTSVVVTAHAV